MIALASLAGSVSPVPSAGAGHSPYRGLSLHYSQRGEHFEGRIKSDVSACLGGTVDLVKAKRGANRVVGSAAASSDGSWSISKRARKGRFYARTGSFESAAGLCRAVRSPVLDFG